MSDLDHGATKAPGDPSAEELDHCSTVLQRAYEYIDGELPGADVDAIRRHLADCAPCLREYDLELAMKALVRRCCAEQAPAALRVRVLTTITQIRVIDS